MIKPFVMGRKGFLFSDSRRGAYATAAAYPFIQSAILNGLNPEAYVRYVLDVMRTEGMKPEVMEGVVPYSKELPKELYSKK